MDLQLFMCKKTFFTAEIESVNVFAFLYEHLPRHDEIKGFVRKYSFKAFRDEMRNDD